MSISGGPPSWARVEPSIRTAIHHRCNVLGGCYGSTGPAATRRRRRAPMGRDLPPSPWRLVRAHRHLLDALGVRRIRLVVGGSLGGMQALEWAASGPDRVAAAAVIAAPRATRPGPSPVRAQRAAIAADPRWCGGPFPPDDASRRGFAAARMIAMCSYRAPRGSLYVSPAAAGDGRGGVQAWLRYHGGALVDRFDAASYVR